MTDEQFGELRDALGRIEGLLAILVQAVAEAGESQPDPTGLRAFRQRYKGDRQ